MNLKYKSITLGVLSSENAELVNIEFYCENEMSAEDIIFTTLAQDGVKDHLSSGIGAKKDAPFEFYVGIEGVEVYRVYEDIEGDDSMAKLAGRFMSLLNECEFKFRSELEESIRVAEECRKSVGLKRTVIPNKK